MSDGQLRGMTRAKAAAHTKTEAQVRVLYGVHAIEASLAGRAVGDVRQALRQALNISPQAVAVVDGREVEEGFILLAGQQLEFVRLAGEKGGLARCSPVGSSRPGRPARLTRAQARASGSPAPASRPADGRRGGDRVG